MTRTHSESAEQRTLFRWAALQVKRYPELDLLFAIPNGGFRHPATAARMKAEGVKPGIPDLFLPVARGNHHGLWIELKAGETQPRESQLAMLSKLEQQGYQCFVAWGWEQASEILVEYLELPHALTPFEVAERIVRTAAASDPNTLEESISGKT